MCGRYSTGKVSKDKFEEVLGTELDEVPSSFNLSPGRDNPTIVGGEDGVVSARMRWGFAPRWSRDPATMASSINARSETMAEKPFFRDSFRSRRCLVPADGWYEWLTDGRRKTPYFIHLPDEEYFAFAGLWDRCDGRGGASFSSYAVVTMEAAESVRLIHHRMPVVLPEGCWSAWLDSSSSPADLSAILKIGQTNFESRTVSDLVNDVGNDGPDLTRAVSRDRQRTLDLPW